MGDIRSSNTQNVENSKTTLAEVYWPLMLAPTLIAGRCFICGRYSPLNQHHYVWRSWGRFYRQGREVPKPTITLCGFGNNLKDSHGRYYCHGLAHHRMLHFRWHQAEVTPKAGFKSEVALGGGHLEYIITEEPTKYEEALQMDGWKRIRLLKEGTW